LLSGVPANFGSMTESFDASLTRLRQARSNVVAVAPERVVGDPASAQQYLDTVLPAPPAVEAHARSSQSQQLASPAARLATAAAGQVPGLANDALAGKKVRIDLAPKAALAAVLALLTLGGGVAAAYAWTGVHSQRLPSTVIELADPVQGGASVGALPTPADALPTPADAPDATSPDEGSPAERAVAELVVHVAGAVVTPGIVTVPEGARVADALSLAGGATTDGEVDALNLARVLVDGEKIYVPKAGEVAPIDIALQSGSQLPAASSPVQQAQINLNTADANGLQQLPGVGPAIAERIIKWRQNNGEFRSVSELQEVKGIGPTIMANIAGLVTV